MDKVADSNKNDRRKVMGIFLDISTMRKQGTRFKRSNGVQLNCRLVNVIEKYQLITSLSTTK